MNHDASDFSTLTRCDQVLAVLKAGGHLVYRQAISDQDGGAVIALLFDVDGNEVPAWQQSITEARNHLHMVNTDRWATDDVRAERWDVALGSKGVTSNG